MRDQGMSLPELMVAVAILGIVGGLGCISGAETVARQRLENASRSLSQGIELARSSAQRTHTPCGMSLTAAGWDMPRNSPLPACLPGLTPLRDTGFGDGTLRLTHNLPAELRFSSNGLVLDGGTVVLTMSGTSLQRCLVMALPLGIVRLGRYRADPTGSPDSNACIPDPSL